MTDTLNDVAATDKGGADQQRLAEQILAQAKGRGVELVGPSWVQKRLL